VLRRGGLHRVRCARQSFLRESGVKLSSVGEHGVVEDCRAGVINGGSGGIGARRAGAQNHVTPRGWLPARGQNPRRRSSPTISRTTDATSSASPSSFTVTGYSDSESTTASSPCAAAIPWQSRTDSSWTRARDSAENDRTDASKCAESGTTCGQVPAWNRPTVTTTGSNTSNRRVTIVSSAMTISQAAGIGSNARWGPRRDRRGPARSHSTRQHRRQPDPVWSRTRRVGSSPTPRAPRTPPVVASPRRRAHPHRSCAGPRRNPPRQAGT
jgi:hypothetical protein